MKCFLDSAARIQLEDKKDNVRVRLFCNTDSDSESIFIQPIHIAEVNISFVTKTYI